MEKDMKREDFAKFLGELRNVNDNGQDTDAFVKKYEHRNVYFYNDGCIKKIRASEKNLILTTDLVNAALILKLSAFLFLAKRMEAASSPGRSMAPPRSARWQWALQGAGQRADTTAGKTAAVR